MAGGNFNKLVGKTRPGTYINFVSTRRDSAELSERGIVVIPLIGHNWGPEKTFITLTNEAPDAARARLGYSVYDNDPAGNMLLIREAFKCAAKVIVYIPKAGTAAAGTGDITAAAKYGGTRGNDLSYSVVTNPVFGFDVTIYLAGNIVSSYTELASVEDLIAQNDPYITFTGTGGLAAAAGVAFTGGADVTTQNADITTFLDDIEGVKFNTLCFPVTDSALHSACLAKIKYLRDNVGRGVKAVIPDSAANFEGIINVTNAVILGDKTLTNAQTCAWTAGADAGASFVQSNTCRVYEGATAVSGVKTNEQAIAAIKNGEFFFSYSESQNGEAGAAVVVEYDINSLTDFSAPKDKTYRKNRVIRVFDTFSESIQTNFPPNKYDNSPDGWDIMEGIGKSILKLFLDAGAIKNVDYDADFKVDRGASGGDETYFNVGLEPIDSAEKLYFTVATR